MDGERPYRQDGSRDEAARLAPARCWASLRLRFPAVDLHHDEVVASIAAAVDEAPVEPVLARLDDAARPLFGLAGASVVDAAARLEEVLGADLALRADPDDHRGLLLDRVLERRLAHPILVAVLGHEIARRAGLSSGVCRSVEGWWTALFSAEGCVLVGPSGADVPPTLQGVRMACAHETALAVLVRLRALAPPPRDHRAELMLQELVERAGDIGPHSHEA